MTQIIGGMFIGFFISKTSTMETNRSNSSNAREHTANIKKEMEQVIDHLRDDISKVTDPKAKALFETSEK
jgi:hypothetical protein